MDAWAYGCMDVFTVGSMSVICSSAIHGTFCGKPRPSSTRTLTVLRRLATLLMPCPEIKVSAFRFSSTPNCRREHGLKQNRPCDCRIFGHSGARLESYHSPPTDEESLI